MAKSNVQPLPMWVKTKCDILILGTRHQKKKKKKNMTQITNKKEQNKIQYDRNYIKTKR